MAEFTEQQILGGYAFKDYMKEMQRHNTARYNEIKHLVKEGAVLIKKQPTYGRCNFSGELLSEEAKKLTVSDIALLADHGNLCFGGTCQKTGDTFRGSYNTD